MGWIAVAAVIWASYAALLGYVGGKTFEDDHTQAFLLAFVTALSATVLIEVVRHFWGKWRGGDAAEILVEEIEEQTAPTETGPAI